MAGDDPLLPSLSGFSPASVFQSNKVHGRLQVCEMPSPPPPLLTRKPGRCSEPLEKLKQEYEAKGFFDKLLTEKDAWGNPKEQLWARLFKSECEKWPDQIPQSFLDEQRQRLNDHLTGKAPLPPEQSLKLRADLSTLEDIYRPGPRLEAPISAEEQAWLDQRNLRMSNDLGIALLGPLFGGPGAITRALGGTEEQVAAANELGVVMFDMSTAAGIPRGGGRGAVVRRASPKRARRPYKLREPRTYERKVVNADGSTTYTLKTKTGETFEVTFRDGYPDLTPYRYTGDKGPWEVPIDKVTGDNRLDFPAANKAAGYGNGMYSHPSGYTWHHDALSGNMQLIRTDIHSATPHTGTAAAARNAAGGP